MTERWQKSAWIALACAAVVLAASTVCLYRQSRGASTLLGGSPPYRIVYCSMQDEDSSTLVDCNMLGRDVQHLTDGNTLDIYPIAAPLLSGADKQMRIAFVRLDFRQSSPRDEVSPGGVFVVNAAGGEAQQVGAMARYVLPVPPAWSPNGAQLAFGGAEDLNADGASALDETGLYVCDLSGGQTQRAADALVEGERLLWSPAGAQGLVPTRSSNLPSVCLFDGESGKLEPILNGSASAACWSPDGQQVAAYSTEDHRIHIFASRRSSPEALLDSPPGTVTDIVWAPDAGGAGQGRLLVVSAAQSGQSAGSLYSRSASPNARESWQLLADAQALIYYPSVSPDGRYVAFTLLAGGAAVGQSGVPAGDLYLLQLGKAEPLRLTSEPGFEGLATWVPIQANRNEASETRARD